MLEERLFPDLTIRNLETQLIGQRVIYYPVVSSTMEVATEVGRLGAEEGTIVIAGEQTAGRGRLGRTWFSTSDSIALSIILRPTLSQLPRLNMVTSLAIAQAIEKTTGLATTLKWPNDILIKGKKVGGILSEGYLRGSEVDFAVVGIGLNVNLDPVEIPEIADIATSLSAQLGHPILRSTILKSLLKEMEVLYLALQRGEPVHQQWRQRLQTLDQRVRVTMGDKVVEGCAEDVDPDGCLHVRDDDGHLTIVAAGDLTAPVGIC
ncbi:MAG: biotin--[acetyl-CoA-carboxylase] ligase [Chloroflexi bacterium]|nr:biotin--[acetyl-CoA-carboxylase] ligase [Chloroflexota bacterium]